MNKNRQKTTKKAQKNDYPKGALVLGGGISGIQSALDLADAGFMTYVIERSPSIGGRMAQLDKTFPTNDCAMCILSPKLVAAARHPNIKLFTNSELTEVRGEAGKFRVKITKHPRYLDENKCVGCGECAAKCPVKVPNEFDLGLSLRKAIFIPFPQAVPMLYSIDQQNCLYLTKGKCGVCKKICKAEAIDYEQKPIQISLDIGAIIVSTGYEQFDPSNLLELGYKDNKNVITGLEFERLLNASGPTNGKIIRPSDGKPPKRIVFIQCVGSRDIKHAEEYCSRICCMYAIKEALIAKEHQPDLKELTILNMEIRAYGKGFEEYYQRAVNDGIKFIKGRASQIFEDRLTGELVIQTEDVNVGELKELRADLVVLSSAIVPNSSNKDLAKILDIDADDHGFFKERSLPETASESMRAGIFLSGCSQGPKDIPDSVAQGSAAAVLAERYLTESRLKSAIKAAKTTTITDMTDETPEPRIGVFVCHCGINIAGVLDVPALVEYAKGLPDVVYATNNLYTCSDDAQRLIQDMIKEHHLTRVVVASCTPRTHEPIFKDTCQRAGLNPYLFEMTNIRDQCSWVHMHEPEAATKKAKDLIKMAVARARQLRPLTAISTPIDQSVTVIGGGITGMQCALALANLGIQTTIIEQSEDFGGRLIQLNKLANAQLPPERLINEKLKKLRSADVRLLLGYRLTDIRGYVGNFDLTLEEINGKQLKPVKKIKNEKPKKKIDSKSKSQIEHHTGAIILAIGADLFDAKSDNYYGYGKFTNVITNLEFENILKNSGKSFLNKTITFIQCVGAREHDKDSGNTGCSRYCCQTTLHQAHQAITSGAKVNILHRGIRAFSKYAEELYYQNSDAGVRFIQFPEGSKNIPTPIKAGKNKGLIVWVHDIGLDQDIYLPSDYVVLTLAMVPKELETEQLQKWLKVPRSADGFFLELHPKLAPVETNTTGIYICGCAQGPKDVVDSLAQASAAAAKVAALVSNSELTADPVTASVNESICWGCGTCENLCAYGAIHVEDTEEGKRSSKVNSALCKGCGVCASNCPSGAITVMHFTNDQLQSMIQAFSEVAE